MSSATRYVRPRNANCRIRSSWTPISTASGATLGGPITQDLPVDEYWFWNLRNTVRFDKAIAAALPLGVDTFVELAEHPHAAVGDSGESRHPDRRSARRMVVGTSHRTATDLSEFTRNLAQLAVHDLDYPWECLGAESDGPAPTAAARLPEHPDERRPAVAALSRRFSPSARRCGPWSLKPPRRRQHRRGFSSRSGCGCRSARWCRRAPSASSITPAPALTCPPPCAPRRGTLGATARADRRRKPPRAISIRTSSFFRFARTRRNWTMPPPRPRSRRSLATARGGRD